MKTSTRPSPLLVFILALMQKGETSNGIGVLVLPVPVSRMIESGCQTIRSVWTISVVLILLASSRPSSSKKKLSRLQAALEVFPGVRDLRYTATRSGTESNSPEYRAFMSFNCETSMHLAIWRDWWDEGEQGEHSSLVDKLLLSNR